MQINLSYFETPVTANNIFYFVGNDGEHGNELWRSDGTTQGTYMVKDLRTNDLNSYDFYSLTEFKDEVYFSAIESGSQYALFRSDGTAAGTRKITNMQAIVHYIPYKDQLLLFPVQSEPPTLWSSDGTVEGTSPVKTLEGATPFYDIHNAIVVTTGSNCCGEEEFEGELWRTDGTECGTFEVQTGLKVYLPLSFWAIA